MSFPGLGTKTSASCGAQPNKKTTRRRKLGFPDGERPREALKGKMSFGETGQVEKPSARHLVPVPI